ncbi:hypothetical protein F5B20DRAFT_585012 [Whalleya microplaca]|nr:hypothetical protein F5B20DRAFT_585012 [Whalleya microplaca]
MDGSIMIPEDRKGLLIPPCIRVMQGWKPNNLHMEAIKKNHAIHSYALVGVDVFFWSLEIQFLLQIIINRLGLLVVVVGRARKLKWITGLIITIINISVFCIWVPARLQISHRYIDINDVWDRTEKGIFAVTDFCLNLYFVYLVRSRLINNGLVKYNRVYKMNLVMVSISMSLDVILIALMSLQNTMVYLLFHPVAYLLKLVIEMKMAELIAKVVRAANPLTGTTHINGVSHDKENIILSDFMSGIHDRGLGQRNSVHVGARQDHDPNHTGIQRTTETSVTISGGSRDDSSTSESGRSSTQNPKELEIPELPRFQVP